MRWASDYRLLQCSLGLCTNRIVEHGYTEVSWHTFCECSRCSVRGLQLWLDPPRRIHLRCSQNGIDAVGVNELS